VHSGVKNDNVRNEAYDSIYYGRVPNKSTQTVSRKISHSQFSNFRARAVKRGVSLREGQVLSGAWESVRFYQCLCSAIYLQLDITHELEDSLLGKYRVGYEKAILSKHAQIALRKRTRFVAILHLLQLS
jgi:hypothetical protein